MGTRFIATEECDASDAYKEALINAVKGDVDNGLIFCSAKVEQIKKIQTVREVMEDLGV